MPKPLMKRLFPAIFLIISAGCSDTSEILCEDAFEILSNCSGVEQAGCADNDPAALRVASCPPSDRADVFGNGVPGESCIWNWQCKGDEKYTCNHGNCYRRNTEGNLCDRGDDDDCLSDLFCADDLSSPNAIEGVCSSTEDAVIPALYAETIRPEEELDFEANALQLLRIIVLTAAQRLNGDTTIRRAFHAKNHGCMLGEFQVAEGLSPDLRVGPVFSEPEIFPAWVRFSNGTITITPDEDSAVQGLAIKLMGVEGEKILSGDEATATTQDFLMINLPGTPTTNANEFVELAQAQFDGGIALGAYLLTHPVVAFRALSLTGSKEVASARTESYWAGGAYQFGERAMKYSARPCEGSAPAIAMSGDDYLRGDLSVSVASEPVCFDFYVQFQLDAVKQSIEDSAVIWEAEETPAHRVARLIIPQHETSDPQRALEAEECDSFSFNPWHSSPDYRPLGVVNRSRRKAYEASKGRRGSAPEPIAGF